MGIQVGAVSFLDEGTEQVLDVLQEKGAVNALFLASFSHGRGIAGRQVPGEAFPDHGLQKPDLEFHGGNFATPHPQFYRKTRIQADKAPDYGTYDVLADVVPRAHRRGLKAYAWYEDEFRANTPGVAGAREVDWQGRPGPYLCAFNPDYREFVLGLTEDYCASYDLDGIMWGSERQGPLNTALTSKPNTATSTVTCFCPYHQAEARRRGIDVARAIEGYGQLDKYLQAARGGERPTDGYFVAFWRLLLDYPELLAWEKLWTDGKHALYADISKAAKHRRPGIEVGFHLWHVNSFSPFFRAEQEYLKFAAYSDFLKVVMYNNCGGPRYATYQKQVGSTLFRDIPPDDLLALYNHWLGYAGEAKLSDLPSAGLSANYVAAETKRAVDDVQGRCRIYSGLDVDIPTGPNEKKTTPPDVFDSTRAAFQAGAAGVVFSRKYSEMRLANLAAGGRAAREFGG